MSQDLQKKLKSGWEGFTASEQRIAGYLLQNLSGIPFETATSLGQRVGVSAMTVGRFLRKLGYAGVAELKEELRGDTTWLKLYHSPAPAEGPGARDENLEGEIRALSAIHALARGGEWKAIVRLLASADRVSVASFQLGRFLGLMFATLLQQIRPRVAFASGVDGAYTDVLIDSTENSCVVLIDERRYSRHFRILAEEVAARGIPLVILTDTQCYWARQLTPHVLMLPIQPGRAWHSFTAFGTLFNLLLGAVIRARGSDAVYERIERITAMRQQFIGFSGPSLSSAAPAGEKPKRRARKRRPA
ncbi:MAG TPA: MurR/RpiR family transcriptional regulator [Rhodanobacteraceae bacterium]|jgi:DNA-binding MurR/RpiR family transcriptional regulator|nr:MurR/RpiR family transcriptional regulator [Rhodanobacteraceae bacterium]